MLRVCIREVVRNVLAITAALLLASMLAAVGTGFGVDERELDRRLTEESHAAIRQTAQESRLSPGRMLQFASRAIHGDFGTSTSLGRPVAELLRERVAATLPPLAIAWLITVIVGVSAAAFAALRPRGTANLTLTVASTFLISIPCAVLALLFAWMRLPVVAALVAAAIPQAFRFAQGVLNGAGGNWNLLAARARGVGGPGLAIRHLLYPAAPELVGVATMTLTFLIGAAIPIEALSGVSGLGHLVWLGAIGRDIPVIATMTLLVSVATLSAGALAELSAAAIRTRRTA